MAIGRTARGTITGKIITSLTSPSFTAAAGSTIVAALDVILGGVADSVTWNGVTLNAILTVGNLIVYAAYNVSAGTASVVADLTTAAPGAAAMTVIEITGCATAPLDKSASTTGSSTTPSSGASAATTQAAELLLGFVGTNGPQGDTAGTWSNSFNAGQRAGTTGSTATSNVTVADGYLIVAATAAYTAAKTGITSRAWEAGILTFKELSTPAPQSVTLAAAATSTSDAPALTAAAGGVSATLAAATSSSAAPAAAAGAGGVSATLAVASSVSAAPASTAGAGGVSKTASVAPSVSAAPAVVASVGGVASTLLVAGSLSAAPAVDAVYANPTLYYPGAAVPAEASSVIPDPWDGAPLSLPETVYQRANAGMRNCGSPYFALVQNNLASSVGIPDDLKALLFEFALHSMPLQSASPDEIHYLFSCHQPTGSGLELYSIGITPNGRIAAKNKNTPALMTPINTIRADGIVHQVIFAGEAAGRSISLDGVIIVRDDLLNTGPYDGGWPVRFMLFNGANGLTRCECTISHVEFQHEGPPIGWLLNEKAGGAVKDWEFVNAQALVQAPGPPNQWINRDDMTPFSAAGPFPYPPGPPWISFYDFELDLAAQWYDPALLGYARPWGNVPSTSPASCYSWQRRTAYINRDPVPVEYTPLPRTP